MMTTEELIAMVHDPNVGREEIQAAMEEVLADRQPEPGPVVVHIPAPAEAPKPIIALDQYIDGTLESGFRYRLPKAALDDMELLEMLTNVGEDATVLPQIVKKLLGDAQKKALYDHLRDPETGRVAVTAVSNAVAEIFNSAGAAGKN